MANLDEIFKSDLDENKKKSKTLFGKLLVQMRKNNHIRLYSLMSEVFDTDYVDNTLILILGDKSTYEMLNNKNDIMILDNQLKLIDESIKIELKCEAKQKFDLYQFEEYLKREFGKILTIK